MVQPFTVLYHFTILDRKGTPFGYLLLINGALYLFITCNMSFAPWGVVPYLGYIGMCRTKGYVFFSCFGLK